MPVLLRKICRSVCCALGLLASVSVPGYAQPAAAVQENPDQQNKASTEKPAEKSREKPCVILLHGITKDATSMEPIARTLQQRGFYTVNLDYPSRSHPIEVLSVETIPRGLKACEDAGATPVHFVAHSMGGLLVRYYFDSRDASAVSSVVMLGTPNQGSRLGNFLSCIPWIKDVNGPAGKQMGVDSRSIPSRLGPVPFPLGVIAGTRSFNPLFAAIIDGDDDGRVGLPSTYVQGTCARVTYPLTHDGLTGDFRVIDQVVAFLESGNFSGDGVETFSCNQSTGK